MAQRLDGLGSVSQAIWEFPKVRGTFFGGPYNRILLFRVLYQGPLSISPHYPAPIRPCLAPEP